MDVVLVQSTEDLLCCRVCLLTDCKLFNIHEYKLADAFSRISGTPVFKGRLPQYLCTYCHTLLLKCAQFRLMCLRTERCLKHELVKGELNTDRILKINRTAHQLVHLTITEIENLDFPAKSLVEQRNVVGICEPKIERVAKGEDTDNEADTDDIHEAADCSDSDSDTHVDYDEILANLNANKYKEKEPSVAVVANQDKADIVKGNAVKVASNINTVAANVRNGNKVHRKEPSVDVAQNKDKAGMLKRYVVPSNINNVAANVRNRDKTQGNVHSVDIAQNKDQIGIVNGNIVKIASNIHTIAANVRNGNKVQAKEHNEVVAQNEVKLGSIINTVATLCLNRDKVNMPGTINTVHADNPVSKPNLKMELEMLQGQLKITVVNDEKNIQTSEKMEEIDTEVVPNNDQVKAVMCDVGKCTPEEILLKSAKSARRNTKKRTGNGTNEKKSQAIIFKSSEDMIKMLGIANIGALKKIGGKNKSFDATKFEMENGVKIIALSKEEQLEEIALRKKSTNYLESRYKCDDCGKGFGAECTYNNHRLRHSSITGEVVCEICSVHFPNKRRLRGHLVSHQFKLVCDTCGFVSRSRYIARAHHAMHEGKTYVCPHCDKVFRKPSTYMSHVRIAHPAAHVACELCGETFIGKRGLHTHFQFMHKHSEKLKLLVQEQHNCTICSASFLSLDALNTHTDLGEHGGSPCEQCGESCASEEALQAHVEARHPREEHRCEECRMTFSSRTAFDVHYKRKHLNQRQAQHAVWRRRPRPSRRTPRPLRQVMCDQCGRVLKLQCEAQLRDHMNKHLGLRPYACPECPMKFAAKYLLKPHMRKHTGERPYQCSLCPLAFTIKGNMQRHYKVVHLGEHDNAACPMCARVCTTRTSLRIHIQAVHQRMGWPKRNRTNERKRSRLPDDKQSRGADGEGERSPVQRKRTRQDSLSTERREVESDEEYSSSPPTPQKWTSGAVDSDGSSPPPPPPRRRRFQL